MADTQGEPSSVGFPPESSQPDSNPTLSQTVDIHIVSPTVGVPTLDFPSLPVETTVRQLKDRIQEALHSHPAHDHQRLIHRGRLLDPDDLSLRDIMTTDQVRSPGSPPQEMAPTHSLTATPTASQPPTPNHPSRREGGR
jgi:hypothetical protein